MLRGVGRTERAGVSGLMGHRGGGSERLAAGESGGGAGAAWVRLKSTGFRGPATREIYKYVGGARVDSGGAGEVEGYFAGGVPWG